MPKSMRKRGGRQGASTAVRRGRNTRQSRAPRGDEDPPVLPDRVASNIGSLSLEDLMNAVGQRVREELQSSAAWAGSVLPPPADDTQPVDQPLLHSDGGHASDQSTSGETLYYYLAG